MFIQLCLRKACVLLSGDWERRGQRPLVGEESVEKVKESEQTKLRFSGFMGRDFKEN
jgi:hypothetical protein